MFKGYVFGYQWPSFNVSRVELFLPSRLFDSLIRKSRFADFDPINQEKV